MDRPVDFDVPATFCNWNLARLAWSYFAIALLMLWINVRSFYGLGWLGVALQVVFQVVFAAAGALLRGLVGEGVSAGRAGSAHRW